MTLEPCISHSGQQHDAAAEDAATLERLREKWKAGAQSVDASDQPDHGADSLSNVRLCQVCQGSGMQPEVHEHRRLETNCSHCQGEGVLIVGGPPCSKPAAGSAAAAATQQNSSKARHGGSQAAKLLDLSTKHRTHSKLQTQLKMLQDRIDRLAQEARELQTQLDVQTGSPDQRAMQQELLCQLQTHLSHLTAMHSSKSGELRCLCS